MKLISHRGNLFGPEPETENAPERIDYCISLGVDVEIDVWFLEGNWFLGHDYPNEKIKFDFLEQRKYNLWIHCKNTSALGKFSSDKFDGNYFWHENDKFTMTSKGFLWTYPEQNYSETFKTQVLLDFSRISTNKFNEYKSMNVYGLCLDYIEGI